MNHSQPTRLNKVGKNDILSAFSFLLFSGKGTGKILHLEVLIAFPTVTACIKSTRIFEELPQRQTCASAIVFLDARKKDGQIA
jgi:hypothetical protein